MLSIDEREEVPAEPIRLREAREVRESGEASEDDQMWGDWGPPETFEGNQLREGGEDRPRRSWRSWLDNEDAQDPPMRRNKLPGPAVRDRPQASTAPERTYKKTKSLEQELAEDRELQARESGRPAEEIAVEKVKEEEADKGDETAETLMEVELPKEGSELQETLAPTPLEPPPAEAMEVEAAPLKDEGKEPLPAEKETEKPVEAPSSTAGPASDAATTSGRPMRSNVASFPWKRQRTQPAEDELKAPPDSTEWDARREVFFDSVFLGDTMLEALTLARRNGQQEGVRLMIPAGLVERLSVRPEGGSSERYLHATPAGLKVFVITHGNARRQLFTGKEGYDPRHQWRNGTVTVAYCEDGTNAVICRPRKPDGTLKMLWTGYSLIFVSPGPRLEALRVTGVSLPWEKPEFRVPPAGKSDRWVNSLLASGWMVRAHGGRRHRLFHPLHKGCPWDQSDMERRRITVVFNNAGERVVLHDEWDGAVRNPSCLREGESWTGWTFFHRKTSLTAPSPVSYAAGAMEPGDPSTASSATASDAQEVVIAADTPQSTMVEVGRRDQLEVPDPPYPDALRLRLPLGYGGNPAAAPRPKERAQSFFNQENPDGDDDWEPVGEV